MRRAAAGGEAGTQISPWTRRKTPLEAWNPVQDQPPCKEENLSHREHEKKTIWSLST